jgi:hypothetical protein
MGDYKTFLRAEDAELMQGIAEWAKANAGKAIRPTGIKERLLLPHISARPHDFSVMRISLDHVAWRLRQIKE